MCVFNHDLRARFSDDHRKMMDVIESNLKAWVDRHARYEQLAYTAAVEIRGSGHQSAEALVTSQATNIASRLVGLVFTLRQPWFARCMRRVASRAIWRAN
jgi:hypothetical protein